MTRPTSKEAKWTLERIRSLSPEAFEELTAFLFRSMGFEYEVPTPTRRADWGIDGVAFRIDELGKTHLYYVQCKQYTQQKVGAAEIREFRGALSNPISAIARTLSSQGSQEPEAGYFVTSSSFTRPALEEAQKGRGLVFTIDGKELVAKLNEYRIPVRDRDLARLADLPRGIYGLDGLSTYYIEVGKPNKALRRYEEAVERSPLDIRAWSNLGNLYRKLGQVPQAVACWDRALEPGDGLGHELQTQLGVTLDKVTINLALEASVARAYALIKNAKPIVWILPAREAIVYEMWFDDIYEAISSEHILSSSKSQVRLDQSPLAMPTHLALLEQMADAIQHCIEVFTEGVATSFVPRHFAPVIFHLGEYDILAEPQVLPVPVLVTSLKELEANAPERAQAAADLVQCASEVVLAGKLNFGKLYDLVQVLDYCRQLQQMGLVGSVSRGGYFKKSYFYLLD
ncbi:MAG: restriction endonuclease [Anaerolineae bacterium]